MPHVLVVDDDINTRDVLVNLISTYGLTISVAGNLRDAVTHLVCHLPDIIFTNLKLPDGDGIKLLENVEEYASKIKFVVVTPHDTTIESIVNVLKLGASDYLIKPIDIQRAEIILAYLTNIGSKTSKNNSICTKINEYSQSLIIGNSSIMKYVYEQLNKVAPTTASVLLIGESGTGKELAAQLIHKLSTRSKHSFISINCGAISPQLIESEIFGHERGSFTGAERQHKGYFERANGGTLFLDEITEMPVDLQVKLLRVIETGVFMRVGTTKEIVTDIRFIAATNIDPLQAVEKGKLRLDLYYRLNVFPIQLPPLHKRNQDIQFLAEIFLSYLNKQFNTNKKFLPCSFKIMKSYNWPGNIRELKNYVYRAYIMTSTNFIDANVVPLQLFLSNQNLLSKQFSFFPINISFGMSLSEVNQSLILNTLKQCNGIKKHTAKILGISLKTLNNYLLKYNEYSKYKYIKYFKDITKNASNFNK